MIHPDENTLELYVLRAPEVKRREGDIEAHLLVCEGCRRFVDEMRTFYQEFDIKRTKGAEQSDRASAALARVQQEGLLRDPSAFARYVARPVRTVDRVRFFTRAHPVVAGGGLIGFAAAALFLGQLLVGRLQHHADPAYVILNASVGKIEVYDQQNMMLWDLPGTDLSGYHEGERNGNKFSAVADLDGDGSHEVLITIPSPGGPGPDQNVIRVYDAQKALVKSIQVAKTCEYKGTAYKATSSIRAILVGDFDDDGRSEVLALAGGGRSPSVLVRFDGAGNELGEYWHFGTLNTMAVLPGSSGLKEIVLGGTNDVQDRKDSSFSALSVMQPGRLTGKTESNATDGFGLRRCEAEVMYIRLPWTDIGRKLGPKSGVYSMSIDSGSAERMLTVFDQAGLGNQKAVFEYVFDSSLGISKVLSDDISVWFRDKLVKEGKLRGQVDQAYLAALKQGVEYYDGKDWTHKPARIGPLRARGRLTIPGG